MLLVRQMLSKFILYTMKIMIFIIFADIPHVINFSCRCHSIHTLVVQLNLN